MGVVKQIDIKNRIYYFYNDIIDIESFDSSLLKIDKKIIQKYWYLQHWIYYNYKIDDCKNIHSVNPLYLRINHASGYIEEKDANKYLIFDSTDENKELLKKYNDVFNGIGVKSKKYSVMSVIMKKIT